MSNGWLWTGDLGYFADGHLFVAGRAKDLIIVRGVNYYAEDLERSAEALPGARAGGVVAFGIYDEKLASDRVVLVVETKLTDAAERQQLAQRVDEAVAAECSIHTDEVMLVEPGTVPKTSSGKRQRSLCRSLYIANQLTPPKSGKLALGMVFMRSSAGYLLMKLKRR
jgi:acyl-CoA synthetase (AMP-forming)/AMP-acid ligase II